MLSPMSSPSYEAAQESQSCAVFSFYRNFSDSQSTPFLAIVSLAATILILHTDLHWLLLAELDVVLLDLLAHL